MLLKYLLPIVAVTSAITTNAEASSNILFKPVTVKPALEGYRKISGALDEPTQYPFNQVFRKYESLAKTAGLDLPRWFDQTTIHGGKALVAKNGREFRFFTLFSNIAYMKNCERDFALQRTKMIQEFFDANNQLTKTETSYLVEAFEMQKNNKMKGIDIHHGAYSLIGTGSRRITKEVEFGCGALQNYAQGYQWPFVQEALYKNITRGYIQTPTLYENVQFQFSKKYSYSVILKDKDKYEITFPDFVPRQTVKN